MKKRTKKLLLTSVAFSADDFGLTEAVNESVEQAHRQGVLTRTSLMVAAPEAADAVRRAKRNPDLRVGLHLVLVDGPSVLGPTVIPDLVDQVGRFGRDQVRCGFAYFFQPGLRRQLRAEITAQFEAFAATGLRLCHADAHKHMHLHPTIGALLIEVGIQFGLTRIRVPAEPPAALLACGMRPSFADHALYSWSAILRGQARRAGLATDDHVFGLAWSGHMTRERVRALVGHLPAGSNELYFHPATRRDPALAALMPDYDHKGELDALLDPELPSLLTEHGIVIAGE